MLVANQNNKPVTNTGVCKFFNDLKGYGFIVDDATQADVFIHAKVLKACAIFPYPTAGERFNFSVIKRDGKDYVASLERA